MEFDQEVSMYAPEWRVFTDLVVLTEMDIDPYGNELMYLKIIASLDSGVYHMPNHSFSIMRRVTSHTQHTPLLCILSWNWTLRETGKDPYLCTTKSFFGSGLYFLPQPPPQVAEREMAIISKRVLR